ncbi:MAG TPA: nuclear transport factor 2 family protein, partial [Gammaproteobacteria bacterium]
MTTKARSILAIATALAIGFIAGRGGPGDAVAQAGALTAQDYQDITQLINRYAYGIDTCGNNGYDYANVFTEDGVFIDRNSDAGFAAGGRVLAQGRDALATLVGG